MKKRKNDFVKLKPQSSRETWYDIYDDWDLIEASFATQYGIRIREHSDMPWDEFIALIVGIMPETPLGKVVSIRAEKDKKVIKNYTPEQRKIYNDWRLRQANKKLENPEQLEKEMNSLYKAFAMAFGSKEVR